jgi:hypothetical protein
MAAYPSRYDCLVALGSVSLISDWSIINTNVVVVIITNIAVSMTYNSMYTLIFGRMERQWEYQLSPQYQPRTPQPLREEDNTIDFPLMEADLPLPPEINANNEDMEDMVFIDVMHDVMRTVVGALLFPGKCSK